jgi:predicted phage terminase large subunit-like protein
LVAEHAQTLGISLRSDTQAAGRWELESGGGYLTVGVGQAVVGYRADLIVIDDPVRGREEAYSEVSRRSVWEWYNTELRTRLRPGGRIVLIMTQWHDDDLAGRLLAEADKGGERWETLVLPAVAEEDDPIGRKPGELLWSDDPQYDYARFLKQEQNTQSPMNFSALFQQRPSPETGEYFLSEWLRPYEKVPDLRELRTYGASDYAVTSRGGDYTCHVVIGIDPGGRLYLLDLWRGQTSPDIWVERMLDLGVKWKPIAWAEESGQIKSSVGPFIDRRQRERKIPLYRRTFPTKSDKQSRAQSIRALMALRGLYVPVKASWFASFQQELLHFPAGKHDDQVDALALIGQMLDIVAPGNAIEQKTPKYDPRKDAYREIKDAEMLDRVMHDNEFHLHTDDDGYDEASSFLTL